MCEKREPSSIIAARLSFSIACPVMVILCFTALSTKTEGVQGAFVLFGCKFLLENKQNPCTCFSGTVRHAGKDTH